MLTELPTKPVDRTFGTVPSYVFDVLCSVNAGEERTGGSWCSGLKDGPPIVHGFVGEISDTDKESFKNIAIENAKKFKNWQDDAMVAGRCSAVLRTKNRLISAVFSGGSPGFVQSFLFGIAMEMGELSKIEVDELAEKFKNKEYQDSFSDLFM